ncbi:MAG TPA: O-antigen ligase family protein [Bryobacteraceae bacterium]|nr:O-antigen ligase family protein [Bryobacteraceae bacterium]
MTIPQDHCRNAAFYCAFASAVLTTCSIALSQILLGLSILALLIGREKLRIPPIWVPLGLFMLGTMLSLIFSGGDPWSGHAQIRKFYVFLMLVAIYTTFRSLAQVRALVLVWTAAATVSAFWGLWQFYNKWNESRHLHRNFYEFYNGARITGLLNHWMTFGGVEMIVLLMGISLLLYSIDRKWKLWLAGAAAVLILSLLLGWTRSIWLATACGGFYLFWNWRAWLIPAFIVPVLLGLLWLNPLDLRDRFMSAFHPHGDVDSNRFRVLCRRTGWEIIKAHPWLGIGPDALKTQFRSWIPPGTPRPLPSGFYEELENLYYQYAAERGVPTMLALLWMLGLILFDFVRALKKLAPKSEARFVLHGGIAVTVAILIAGWYEVNLGDSEVLAAFLSVVGCGYFAVDYAGAMSGPSRKFLSPTK